MTSFDESKHPRGHHSNPGRFTAKTHSEPETALTPPTRTEAAQERLSALRAERDALEAKIAAASCRSLALTVREQYPDAKTVELEMSEIGGSFWTGLVLDSDGDAFADVGWDDVQDIPLHERDDMPWLKQSTADPETMLLDIERALTIPADGNEVEA